MCTKKTLYTAGAKGSVTLRPRERGGKLDFSQVAYSIDCVREVATILDIPMVAAISRLQDVKGAFTKIYSEARKTVHRPTKVVAREVLSL